MLNFEGVLQEKNGGYYPAATEIVQIPAGPAVSVEKQFNLISQHVGRIVQDAEALDITDQDRLDFAVSLAGECKKSIKQFEARRKEVCQGAQDFIDSVRGFVGRYTDRLKGAEAIILKKVNNYKLRIEIDRQKQEALARKASEYLQKNLDREAKKAGVEAPMVPEIVIPKEKTTIKSESGTTAYEVKRWLCTVLDPAQVPRQYCEPIKKLLDDAVKMGVREIPGCKIEEITETRFRT